MPEPYDVFHVVVRALVYSDTEGRPLKRSPPVNLEHWARVTRAVASSGERASTSMSSSRS